MDASVLDRAEVREATQAVPWLTYNRCRVVAVLAWDRSATNAYDHAIPRPTASFVIEIRDESPQGSQAVVYGLVEDTTGSGTMLTAHPHGTALDDAMAALAGVVIDADGVLVRAG